MKSKAHFKSHPIHPILVSFPIAFFTGALIFDILGIASNAKYFETGYYLIIAGLIGAVVAAVPGLIDFIFTIPSNSSAKKRGAKHGIANTTVLVLFALSLMFRKGTENESALIMFSLEIAGFVLLLFAGWMGGTLVYRNQIGVDIRYANAGKWKEETVQPADGLVEIKDSGELGINHMKLLHVDGKRIVVARTEDGLVAFDDHCTHKGGSLAGGSMMCGTVHCPWHGSQFDVRDGSVKAGPAKQGITTYPVENRQGRMFLRLHQ